jgi:alkaline phosphatase
MTIKRFFVKGFLFAAILILGGLGVRLFLQHANASFVYYKPAIRLALRTQANPRQTLPLMPDSTVRNIILFIGDGMGLSHLAAARAHLVGADGRLHLETMPVTGLVLTHAVDDLITDSAASGTALATGVKTTNGSIGVDANGNSQPSILEAARDAGLSTGLVTSTELADATPAAFAAHVAHRRMKAEIAVQMIRARVNVLFGEGAYFYPKTDPRSARNDEQSPVALARELGYTCVYNKEELIKAEANFLLGLFEDLTTDRMKADMNSPAHSPSLSELTEKSLEVLRRNPKGFFLMIEEEGVDQGSHVNRPDYFIEHLRRLDEAVKVGIDFARADGHTLVLVTADHETGGLNLVGGSQKDQSLRLAWATDRHTGQPVPLFAFGPHAGRFTGLKDNTELPRIMADLLGIESFAASQ